MQLIFADHGRSGALFQRADYIIVAIETFAFDREEKLVGSHRARVDGVSLHDFVARISTLSHSRAGRP